MFSVKTVPEQKNDAVPNKNDAQKTGEW